MTVSSADSAWQALTRHRDAIQRISLRTLFADDPGRAERFSCEAAGVFLDYSKNRITDETRALLLALAEACGVRRSIDAMFAG
jgi:glucose-6-phosphate isomerase